MARLRVRHAAPEPVVRGAVRAVPHGASVEFVAKPRAATPAITARGEDLVLSVTAPAVDGAANTALCALIAHVARVPRSAVTLERGATSRHKRVVVTGVSAAELVRAFSPPEVRAV